MTDQPTSVLDRFRRPEYTGENRCLPCTVVNVSIALVLAIAISVLAPPVGAVVLVGSLVAIYLRGYLVPGTPRLTERYLPDRVLARFEKAPNPIEERRTETGAVEETIDRIEARRENAVDPESFLLEVGAVEPCEHEDDLCLTDRFRDRLDEDEPANPFDPGRLATVFDTEPAAIEMLDRPYPAIKIDRRVRKWPSEAALLGDLAADGALRGLSDRWVGVPLEQRLGILSSLRSFRDSCPRCGGPIVVSDGTVESCCRSYEVITFGCAECEEPLLEFSPDELGLGENRTGITP
ncbi:hypothetical protein [Natronorarus salvus]|uniref:hypothetical protein n=1 Tax=Natronorarus salvus TaxID=3117733 RepID=UPI002F260F32